MSRPVTTGTGKRMSIYIPAKLLREISWAEELTQAESTSAFVQDALRYYLDMIIDREGESCGE